MRSLVFEGNTRDAYESMREKDKRLHKVHCKLLQEMIRSDDPSSGLGKPEPLKHNLTGLWSKRISQKDRLIFRFDQIRASNPVLLVRGRIARNAKRSEMFI